MTRWLRRWWPVLLLGLSTIGSYGLVLYAPGVLVADIRDATGWSAASVSGAVSLATVVGAVGAQFTGRALDRYGVTPIFAGSWVVGHGVVLVASTASTAGAFALWWGLGGGVLAAGQHYPITMAVTARAYPERRSQAISLLTFIGGFSSMLFFPVSGQLAAALAWQTTIQVLVGLSAALCLPALVFVHGGRSGQLSVRTAAGATADGEGGGPDETASHDAAGDGYGSVREALRAREVWVLLLAVSATLFALVATQVHHVAALTAGGLSVGAASTLAGLRGLLSLPGRGLMGPTVARFGARRTLGMLDVCLAAGSVALLVAGFTNPLFWGLGFVMLSGLAFGAVAPVNGLYAAEVFGERRLGTLMGFMTLTSGLAAALGPLAFGWTVDATGGYAVGLAGTAVILVAVSALLARAPQASGSPTAPAATTAAAAPPPAGS